MKYSTDQMILAAHVRALALEFWRGERNSISDKWHAQNPGKSREMEEFAAELNKSKTLNKFIVQAARELETVTTVMLKLPPNADGQS